MNHLKQVNLSWTSRTDNRSN